MGGGGGDDLDEYAMRLNLFDDALDDLLLDFKDVDLEDVIEKLESRIQTFEADVARKRRAS